MKRRSFIKTTATCNAGFIISPTLLTETRWNDTSGKGNKIKIGQIGVSHEHASAKINTLKKLPEVFEIVGIVDDRHSSAARFAGDNLKPYDGLRWMSEKELFDTPGLQAVMVETANANLVSTAIRCMEQGLAMHMDKPGGEDLKLFGKLLDGCREKDLPFQMGYMFRNNPAIQFCQKAVRENWLGDIFEIQGNMSHDYGGGQPYQQYLGNFKGGIMFNLGCHIIDIVVSMLGRPVKTTPFLRSTLGAPSLSNNNCWAVLEYPHAIVTINACDQKIDGIKHRYFKIFGSKGSIEFSPLERFDGTSLQLQLTLLEGNTHYSAGTHLIDTGISEDRYKEQLLELAKIIKGEMKNPYTYQHDYITQEVLMAACGFEI